MMLLSPTAQHALRALIHLARAYGNGPVRVQEIAAAEKIPRQFLSKILHDLRNKGLVIATKGPGGGYALARPPAELTFRKVIEIVDGSFRLERACLLGLKTCQDGTACALHAPWTKMHRAFLNSVSQLTLAEAAGLRRRRTNKKKRV